MDKQLPLPARPNLDHLRGQAKALLAQLRDGDPDAVRAFVEHLPAARDVKRAASFKLADAQSVVARRAGFASWAALTRHVEQLRSLEGEWQIARLEIDGNVMPASILERTRILIDGDRFRTESPEGTYEGIFAIDLEASPPHFDIHFVAGPDAGETSHGIFAQREPDRLTLCLGLVHSSRPTELATRPGGGHALEQLVRTSTARPAAVTGGTPPEPAAGEVVREDAAAFEVPLTPLYERLQGEWAAVELVTDGKPMPEGWLGHGTRTMIGNELRVVFGGQTIVHAKVRIDERATPIAVDYYSLLGKQRGTVSYGIMDWVGDDARFVMAPTGVARPTEFAPPPRGTLSRWRRR